MISANKNSIVAVTGLAGHAYGSWAHSPERMWLRDYLPKDAPNTRILTYGYPSKLQASNSTTILQDHTNTFVHRLIDVRESGQCESRPIIFIGHSLGCLIIKKALTSLESMGHYPVAFAGPPIHFLRSSPPGAKCHGFENACKRGAHRETH